MRIWMLTGRAASFLRVTEAELAGAGTSTRMGETEMLAACAREANSKKQMKETTERIDMIFNL